MPLDPFQIVADGDLEGVRAYIGAGENVNKCRWSGFSLLHRAAQLGHTDICQLLIEAGADVNIKSARGWYTPLHCALANGYVETAEYLISKGANPWSKSKYREDPYDYGTNKGFKTVCADLRAKMLKLDMAESIRRHNLQLQMNQSKKLS